MKEKKVHQADGVTFDSREELEFYFWLLILRHHGAIAGFVYHPQTYELSPRQTRPVQVQMKRSVKTKEVFLLRECRYTPDFRVMPGPGWAALKLGWQADESGGFVIDVKGNYSIYNDEKYFSAIQKWLYAKTGVYANKVIPADLFTKTFVPRKAAFNRDGTRRKCYQKCRFYKEFAQSQMSLGF